MYSSVAGPPWVAPFAASRVVEVKRASYERCIILRLTAAGSARLSLQVVDLHSIFLILLQVGQWPDGVSGRRSELAMVHVYGTFKVADTCPP